MPRFGRVATTTRCSSLMPTESCFMRPTNLSISHRGADRSYYLLTPCNTSGRQNFTESTVSGISTSKPTTAIPTTTNST